MGGTNGPLPWDPLGFPRVPLPWGVWDPLPWIPWAPKGSHSHGSPPMGSLWAPKGPIPWGLTPPIPFQIPPLHPIVFPIPTPILIPLGGVGWGIKFNENFKII